MFHFVWICLVILIIFHFLFHHYPESLLQSSKNALVELKESGLINIDETCLRQSLDRGRPRMSQAFIGCSWWPDVKNWVRVIFIRQKCLVVYLNFLYNHDKANKWGLLSLLAFTVILSTCVSAQMMINDSPLYNAVLMTIEYSFLRTFFFISRSIVSTLPTDYVIM